MFRRTALDQKIVVERKNCMAILEMLNDQMSHWDLETTKKFIIERFLWPLVGSDVTAFFEAVKAARRSKIFQSTVSR